MADLWGVGLAAFLLGLFRGLTICLLFCVPGIIPVILGERAGVLRSLWLGFLMSLPRLAVLTLLGLAMGLLGFGFFRLEPARSAARALNLLGYLLLGILLFVAGVWLLRQYEADLDAGTRGRGSGGGGRKKAKGTGGPRAAEGGAARPPSRWDIFMLRFAERFHPANRGHETLFLLWGSLLSLACISEVGVVEGAALGALAGAGSPGPAASAAWGALLMFFFALGAAIPVLMAAGLSGGLGSGSKHQDIIARMRGVSAVLMILLGLYFMITETVFGLLALKGAFY